MRRGMVIGLVLLSILLLVGVGIGAYNAGLSNGLEQTGAEVVRVDDHRGGFGFPFGLILFPLFFFGIFFLLKGAFWGRHWHGGPPGPGYWGGPQGVEEWHRRLHEEGTDRPRGGDEPQTA